MDNDSTYSESMIDATYMKGLLKITETYYPCGYVETLDCEECGEEIVELEDFDPDEEYICPS